MKNDKKNKSPEKKAQKPSKPEKQSCWQNWKNLPLCPRNNLAFWIVGVLLVGAVVLLIYRHQHKLVDETPFVWQPKNATTQPVAESAPTVSKTPKALVAVEENQALQAEHTLQLVHRLVALEILADVLEDRLPMDRFTKYLQHITDPWAVEIRADLPAVVGGVSYLELQALLVPNVPAKSLSLWKRVKRTVSSLVHIRKIDEKDSPTQGKLEGIRVALQNHDVEQALLTFEKLSPKKQNQLSAWKTVAEDRLRLEMIRQKILLQLAEE